MTLDFTEYCHIAQKLRLVCLSLTRSFSVQAQQFTRASYHLGPPVTLRRSQTVSVNLGVEALQFEVSVTRIKVVKSRDLMKTKDSGRKEEVQTELAQELSLKSRPQLFYC